MNADEFESQHYMILESISSDMRDQYELSIATLLMFAERLDEGGLIDTDDYLAIAAKIVHSMTPSEIIELASRPEYDEHRELAMQMLVFGNSPEWANENSQDMSVTVNDASDIGRLEEKRSQWESDREVLRGVTILEASTYVEDGARSYHFTLENNTGQTLREISLAFGIVDSSGQPLGDQKIDYAFSSPLAMGESYRLTLRDNRPQDTMSHDSEHERWINEGSLQGEITSLLTNEGEVGTPERRFTVDDAKRLERLRQDLEGHL